MPPSISSSSMLDLRFRGDLPDAASASRPLPTQLTGVSVAAPDAANRNRASAASLSPSPGSYTGNGGIPATLSRAGSSKGVEDAPLALSDAEMAATAAWSAGGTAAFDSAVGDAQQELKVNDDIDRLISERGEEALPEAIELAESLTAIAPRSDGAFDAKKSGLFEGVTTARALDRQIEKNGVELLLTLGNPADAGKLRQTLEQTKNATALFHITNFGLTLGLAYDQAQTAGDRGRCVELAGLAEKYVKLIDRDGLGQKSTFGAFYLSEKGRGRARRIGLERRLLGLSGADAKGGVKALQNQVLNSVVKPYLQEILNEKFGPVDTDHRENCLGWIKFVAHQVFDAMAEEVVKDIKSDSGLGSLACMLKVALLAPKLLRDFKPEAALPSKVPAAMPPDGAHGADGARSDDGRPGVVFNGPVTITGSAVAIGSQGNTLSVDSHDGDSDVRNGGRRQSPEIEEDGRWHPGDSPDAPGPIDDSVDRAEDDSGQYDVSQLKDRGMPGESATPEADGPEGGTLPGSEDALPVRLTGYRPLAEDAAPDDGAAAANGLSVREEGRDAMPAGAAANVLGSPRRPIVVPGLAVPEGLKLERVSDIAPERQAALGDVAFARTADGEDAVVLRRRRSLSEAPVFTPVVLQELAAVRLKPVPGGTDGPALSFANSPQNVTLRTWGERPPERRPRPVSWSGDDGRGRKVELTWNRETQLKSTAKHRNYFNAASPREIVPRSGATVNRAGMENSQSAAARQDIRRQAGRSSAGAEQA